MLRSMKICKTCTWARSLLVTYPIRYTHKRFLVSGPHSLEEASQAPIPKSPISTYNGLKTVYITRDAIRSQNLWVWFGVAVFGCVAIAAFMPELKIGVSKHTADLATRSLQDETLQMHTRELASQIVQTVLEDPKVLQQASQFIQKLSTMSNTRDAIRSLVVQTLEDRTTMQKLHESAANLTATLLENPKLRARLILLVQDTLNDPRTNEAVMQVVTRVLQDASIRQNVIDLAAQLLLEKNVEQSVTTTITSSVHDTLNDEGIQAHAKDFVSNVVRDHTVQAQSSEALWRTVQYAVTPSWLSWLWPATTTTLPEQKDITVHDTKEAHKGADGMTDDQGGASLDSKPQTSDENTDNVNASIPAGSESCTFEENLTDEDWNHQGFL